MQGILQLAVAVAQVQLVEQQEKDTVEEHAGLVVPGLQH